jgi:hypothetical protein
VEQSRGVYVIFNTPILRLEWQNLRSQNEQTIMLLHCNIQGDSRSPFVGNFLISQNRINMKIGSRL